MDYPLLKFVKNSEFADELDQEEEDEDEQKLDNNGNNNTDDNKSAHQSARVSRENSGVKLQRGGTVTGAGYESSDGEEETGDD